MTGFNSLKRKLVSALTMIGPSELGGCWTLRPFRMAVEPNLHRLRVFESLMLKVSSIIPRSQERLNIESETTTQLTQTIWEATSPWSLNSWVSLGESKSTQPSIPAAPNL